jgi:hypothetical protein
LPSKDAETINICSICSIESDSQLSTKGMCADCDSLYSLTDFNMGDTETCPAFYPCDDSIKKVSYNDAKMGNEITEPMSIAHPGETTTSPIIESNTRAKPYSRQLCFEHGTGRQRRFCVGCQRVGNGGSNLCRGFHGKQKANCKICNHPEYNVKRINSMCTDHKRKQRSVCFECQKEGTGGTGLCSGLHGKRKAYCEECHPDLYANRIHKLRQKYALQSDQKAVAAPLDENESMNICTSCSITTDSHLTADGQCADCNDINTSITFNEEGREAYPTCYPCRGDNQHETDNGAESSTEDTKPAQLLDNMTSSPSISSNLRAKPYSRQRCLEHGPGQERRFCLGCQKEGNGGGSLCKGFHGKQKANCEICHPHLYEARLRKLRQKYARRSSEEQLSDTDLVGLKSSSDSEPLKCLCGQDLVGIDEVHYSICDKCTADAAISIN